MLFPFHKMLFGTIEETEACVPEKFGERELLPKTFLWFIEGFYYFIISYFPRTTQQIIMKSDQKFHFD